MNSIYWHSQLSFCSFVPPLKWNPIILIASFFQHTQLEVAAMFQSKYITYFIIIAIEMLMREAEWCYYCYTLKISQYHSNSILHFIHSLSLLHYFPSCELNYLADTIISIINNYSFDCCTGY